MVLFCCCCTYATVGHIGMEISYFVVLSVITAPHNVLTPHISKTHLPIVLLNVRELQLSCCSKEQSRKREPHPYPSVSGVKPNSFPAMPEDLKIY